MVLDEAFEKEYSKLSKRYALTWALKKNELLNDAVEEIFVRYKITPKDASVLNVCLTVMAMKQTQARIGRRG